MVMLLIVMLTCVLEIIICLYVLYRNKWVYKEQIKALYSHYQLIDYSDMLLNKWWSFNVEDFKIK